MKKKVLICGILGAITLCVVLFVHYANIRKISSNQVEKIVLWSHGSHDQELNTEDAKAFIKLFNKSKYAGKGTGEGGTPEYGVIVDFVDGSYLLFNRFGLHKFEVTLRNENGDTEDWYYIESQDLSEFMSKIMTNAGT